MPNIITPWLLSGVPLEDVLKGMKRFNQIFVVEKEDRNQIIRGVMRESANITRYLSGFVGTTVGNLLWGS